jgi:long-chain acyl-CoA synthetase
MLVDAACHCFSYVPVALYATLGANAVEYVVNHSEISVILCDGKNLDKVEFQWLIYFICWFFLQVLSLEGCKQLKHVVTFDNFTAAQKEKAEQKGVNLYTLKEFQEIGKQNPAAHDPPTVEDYFTIMYTSGTTGNPKVSVNSLFEE